MLKLKKMLKQLMLKKYDNKNKRRTYLILTGLVLTHLSFGNLNNTKQNQQDCADCNHPLQHQLQTTQSQSKLIHQNLYEQINGFLNPQTAVNSSQTQTKNITTNRTQTTQNNTENTGPILTPPTFQLTTPGIEKVFRFNASMPNPFQGSPQAVYEATFIPEQNYFPGFRPFTPTANAIALPAFSAFPARMHWF